MKKKIIMLLIICAAKISHANILHDIQHEISELTDKVPLVQEAINATREEYNSVSGKVSSVTGYFKDLAHHISDVTDAVDQTVGQIKDDYVPKISSSIDSLSSTSIHTSAGTVFQFPQLIRQVMQPIDDIENLVLQISNSGLSVSNSTVAIGNLIKDLGVALEVIGIKHAKNKTEEIQDTLQKIHTIILEVIVKENDSIQATKTVKDELLLIGKQLSETMIKFHDAGMFDMKEIKTKIDAILQQSGLKTTNTPLTPAPPLLNI